MVRAAVPIGTSVPFDKSSAMPTNDSRCVPSIDGALLAPSSLFFDGCSWGCIYYAGVYSGLWQRCGQRAGLAGTRWGGVSSGALLALGGALGKTPADLFKLYDDLANIAAQYGVMGKMSIYHEFVMLPWLPDGGDEWRRLNGRLFVGVTRPLDRFELVSEWSSNRELRDTLHGSMHIPLYMSHLADVKGAWCLDGGFSYVGQATIDDHTVHVGPDHRPCFAISPPQELGYDVCFAPTDAAGRSRLVAQGEAGAAAWCLGTSAAAAAARDPAEERPLFARFLSSSVGRRLMVLFFWWLRSVEQYGRAHALAALCGWLWWRRRGMF